MASNDIFAPPSPDELRDDALFAPPQPHELEEPSALQDLSHAFDEGVPLSGLADKAGAGIAAGIEKVHDAVTGTPSKPFGDLYDKYRAEQEQERADRKERSPVLSAVGEAAGGLVAPAAPGASALGRIGTTAGMAFADRASKDGLEAGMTEGGGAGVTQAALESVPVIGRAAKASEGLASAMAKGALEEGFPATRGAIKGAIEHLGVEDKLTKVLQSAPEKLGQFAKPLMDAVSRGGNKSLAVTNFVLSQQYPSYRETLKKLDQSSDEEQ